MSMFDAEDATIAELSEELIFLIAAVSTDAQRKYAIELFRHFARQIEAEAYLRGQQSIASKAPLSPTIAMLPAPGSIDSAPQHERISLIPPVNWQD